jgi:hypothetical protein
MGKPDLTLLSRLRGVPLLSTQSKKLFDHTSILKTIWLRFCPGD